MTLEQRAYNQPVRLAEVKLLLESMFKREAATVRMILSCLYDVGSADFIEHKVNVPFLRPVLRPVASASQPIVQSLGNLWLQKNGPQLVAEWLYSQVKTKREPAVDIQASDVIALPEEVQKQLLYSQLDLEKLRSTLQIRTKILGLTSCVLAVWIILEHIF